MKKTIILTLLLCCACSVNTSYHIDIDLLSFFNSEDLSQAVIFPPSSEINIYLLPAIEIDTDDSEPGSEASQGMVVNFQPQQTEKLSGFSMKLELEIIIENNSETDKINGDRISIFIAPAEKENIYTEGLRIDLINIGELNPGESSTMTQDFYFEENSDVAGILNSGRMRIGIGIFLTSSAGFVPATYSINELHISSHFSPIGILFENYI